MRIKDVDMLQGSIMKGLWRMSIPIMAMNVLQSLFNVIDMTVLKSFGSGDGFEVGSVGVCATLISLITGLLVGCAAGANAVIARYIGLRDPQKASRAVGASLLFSLLGGLALTVIGVSFAEVFLTWMNCPTELLAGAALYFRLYFVGVPINMLYNFSAAVLRSAGDTRRPMIYLTVGGGLKVLLNLLFVGAFRLSIVGVALATICSWGVSCALGIRALLKSRNEYIRLRPTCLRLYRAELSDVLAIGVPSGIRQALYSIGNIAIAATVNGFGAVATTGLSIADNFDGILYQIAISPAIAVLTYVSQNLGAGNSRRAHRAVLCGSTITISLAATIGLFCTIFASNLASLMSNDPAVIEFARQKMVIVCSTYFLCGINHILGGAMQGMKLPWLPMSTTLLYMCLFRVFWVYCVFPSLNTLPGLYIIWPMGWVLSITTLLCHYIPSIRGGWKKRFPESAPSEA